MHDRDGEPASGIIVGLLDDGRRAWGTTTNADHLHTMLTTEMGGQPVYVHPDGAAEL
jgi:hypothetical protein